MTTREQVTEAEQLLQALRTKRNVLQYTLDALQQVIEERASDLKELRRILREDTSEEDEEALAEMLARFQGRGSKLHCFTCGVADVPLTLERRCANCEYEDCRKLAELLVREEQKA